MSTLLAIRYQSTLVPVRALEYAKTNKVYTGPDEEHEWFVNEFDLAEMVRNGQSTIEILNELRDLHKDNMATNYQRVLAYLAERSF